jgi:hypothetical protein
MVLHVPPTVTDPTDALKRIREQCPKADSKKLLDVFYAVVIDNRALHRAIIAQSFTRALAELSLPPPPPSG